MALLNLHIKLGGIHIVVCEHFLLKSVKSDAIIFHWRCLIRIDRCARRVLSGGRWSTIHLYLDASWCGWQLICHP